MDGCQQSRAIGLYVAFGQGLEDMATLVVTMHPNGSITAAPADFPELLSLLIPETVENIKRLHELADVHRVKRTA